MERSGFATDASELRRLLEKHPDWPIVVLAEDGVNTGDYTWMYARRVTCAKGEILDCVQEVNKTKLYTDREEFAEDLHENLLFEGESGVTLQEHIEHVEERLKEELAKYEPHWRPCIFVYAGT